METRHRTLRNLQESPRITTKQTNKRNKRNIQNSEKKKIPSNILKLKLGQIKAKRRENPNNHEDSERISK